MNSHPPLRTNRRRHAALLFGCLALALAAAPAPSHAQETTDQRFDSLFGAHEPYRAFFQTLRTAIAKGDAKGVAALVSYPLSVRIGGKKTTIANAAAFERHYAQIVTPALRRAVAEQEYDDLFANWQGVSIGDGTLWFSGMGDSQEVRITAINN